MPAAFFTLNIFLRLTFLAWQTANGHRWFWLLDAELNVFQIEMEFCEIEKYFREIQSANTMINRVILTTILVLANFYPLIFSRFYYENMNELWKTTEFQRKKPYNSPCLKWMILYLAGPSPFASKLNSSPVRPLKLTSRKYFNRSAPRVGRISSQSPGSSLHNVLCMSLWRNEWV